ncbi:MAG TPA: hypothetical protein VIM84_02210, partial [Gemmatimonadales bacterium]
MHRRTAVGRLAATVAGISMGQMPNLESAADIAGDPFAVTPENLAESSGLASCPVCQEVADSLHLTPAGVCLRCADRTPSLRATPHSDSFWILSPREIRRAESEIQRLSVELEEMNERLRALQRRQAAEGGNRYDRAVETVRG